MLALILTVSVLVTSFISGVLGMAGGMILMGVYAALLDVSSAMILHGATQITSNGSRAAMLRKSIQWRCFAYYAGGAALALALLSGISLILPKPLLLIILGSMPLLALAVPKNWCPRLTSKGSALTCGFVVCGGQILVGAIGPLLDVFFVRTDWDRKQIIATKAATQCLGHLSKIIYYGALVTGATGNSLSLSMFVVVIPCAILGTRLGKSVLLRLSEVQFRKLSQGAIILLSGGYLASGLYLCF